MYIELINHIFSLVSLFLVFFIISICFLLIDFIKESHIFKIIIFDSLGILFFGIYIFLNYFSILTGKFDLLNLSMLLPVAKFIAIISLSFILYSKLILFKDLIKHKRGGAKIKDYESH